MPRKGQKNPASSGEREFTVGVEPVMERRPRDGEPAGNRKDPQGSEPLLMTAAKGGIFGFAGSIGARILGFALQILVSRLYGPHYYGLFVTGIIFCLVMEIISALGLQKGSMRFLAIAHEQRDFQAMPGILGTALFFPLIAGIMVGAISYVMAPFIARACFQDPELENVLKQFSFAVPFMTLLRTSSDLSRAFKVTRYTVIIEDLLFSSLHIIIFVILHSLGYGFLSIVRSFTVSAVLCSLLMVTTVWRLILRYIEQALARRPSFGLFPRVGDWRRMLGYSLPLMPIGLLFIGDQFTDIVMLGLLSDSGSVGEYGAAAKWVTLFIILARPIYMIFTPMIAGQFGMNQTEQVRFLYRAAIRWTFFLTLPVCVFLLLAREPLMLLFGKGFLHAGPTVLALLLLGNLSTIIVGNAGNLLTMCGHQYKELSCIGGGLVLNILLNWWLIPIYGVYGAAVSTIVSNIVCDLNRLLIVWRYLGVHPFTRHYIAPITTSLVLCLGMTLLPFMTEQGIIGKLVLAFGAGCLVALSILALGLDSRDKETIFMLRQEFVKRRPYSSAA